MESRPISNQNEIINSEDSGEHKKTKYENLLSQKDPEILEKWRVEQEELKKKLIFEDKFNWELEENSEINTNPNSISSENTINYNENKGKLQYIAGMDISASKIHPDIAISALVICDLNMRPVYEKCKIVKMDQPYIPGFLAFREVNHLVDLINEVKTKSPQFLPQVILVDGNGILHVKGFGLASHLGVLVDLPTIGCGKTVFAVDGITKKSVKDDSKKFLVKGGDNFPLKGNSGKIWGYALRPTDDCINPMIISSGHRISNETALKIVKKCIIVRVPQPIRYSDKIGRKIIMAYENFISHHPEQGSLFDVDRYMNEHYDKIHKDID